MKNLSNIPFSLCQEHPCDYLPGESARSIFVAANYKVSASDYGDLAQYGFRRSGNLVYRPNCQHCSACIPLRIPVDLFEPSRIQRRILAKNSDIRVTEKPPAFDGNHFRLYKSYLQARHGDGAMANSTSDDYMRFLTSRWCETSFYEFKLGDKLFAVAIVDNFDAAMSSVYTFFECDFSNRSPGVYAVLWQIQEARKRRLKSLYLGYWIAGCDKMSYKNQYRPLEAYVDGQWRLYEKDETML